MPQPDLILTPFAQDAPPSAVDNIPEVRSPSDPLEKATWTQGFPGLTMIPLAAGGIPPRGQDVNGVLRAISGHVAFQGGGGQYKWSAEYVAAKVGYEKGAVIQSDDGLSSYVSAIDSNTTNPNDTPESIGVEWLPSGGASKANASTTISAGPGLTGGGDLSSNRTLSVQFGTTAGTAVEGNDSRITGPREWIAETVSQAEAETGTSTERRAWTAQRVFQAFRGAAANATELLRGTLRIGTQAEVNAGALDNVAVTPKKLKAGFSISIERNGYIAFPWWMNSFVVVWGYSGLIGGTNTTHNHSFHFAFPSACKFVLVGTISPSGTTVGTNKSAQLINGSESTTGFTWISDELATGGVACGMNFIAFGN